MRVLRTTEVVERIGLSRSTLWRLERTGDFPERVHLGVNSVGWLETDIDSWLNNRRRGLGTSTDSGQAAA